MSTSLYEGRWEADLGPRDDDMAAVRICAVGDSTLAGDGLEDMEQHWIVRAFRRLANELGRPIHLTLLADSNSRLDDLTRQFEPAGDRCHDVLFVAIGTNEWKPQRPTFFTFGSRYRSMLEIADALAGHVVVTGVGDLSVLPWLDRPRRHRVLRPLARAVSYFLDRQIRRAVDVQRAKNRNVHFLSTRDVDKKLRSDPQRYFSSDKAHPNAAGHGLWADLLQRTFPRQILTGQQLPNTKYPMIQIPWGIARIRHDRAVGDPTGYTIVVIPDTPNVLEHYDQLFAALTAKGHNVLGLEMPGLGYSKSTAKDTHSLRAGADWIASVLDHEDVNGRVVVAATCINGLWAAKLAQIDRRVAGLVLGQTPGLYDIRLWGRHAIPPVVRSALVGDIVLRLLRVDSAKKWYRWVTPNPEQFLPIAIHALKSGAQWRLAELSAAIEREETDPLESIQQRCRWVWGAADRSQIRQRPDALEGVGHFPDLEATDHWLGLIDQVAPR